MLLILSREVVERESIKRSLPLDGGAGLCVLGREQILKLLSLCTSTSDLGSQEFSSLGTLSSVLLSKAFQLNPPYLFSPPSHSHTEEQVLVCSRYSRVTALTFLAQVDDLQQ